MNPGGGLITMINSRLSETAFRDQIRTMHANQTPLVDMVEQLGLAGEMSREVRAVVERLSKAQVAAIRQAMIDTLDRAENQLPVDCDLTQAAIDSGTPVTVSIVSEHQVSTIVVRAT
jgi:proline dehydrogenase